ncbi:sensor domain-containing diguanylate cyclase [Parapusillimonas granuli]|uniref:Diguanylate cyclase n=1 Tax=Parapusillimonas granuli TaxID=380911 RepID=A0A853G131_9BURK|nr:diguanylate cyclase [Parapusillimonas granuli]MBB5214832.1 diguanylate cyclase (GGDEF)-like protein [Parapusillimonas granuli]NYT48760.1 diguanylate cyclase [Parapusillimonas granuli]
MPQAHTAALDALTPGQTDYFDVTPISLWLEDYSELRALFGSWRAQGVTDLRAFLAREPQRLKECSDSIRLLRVNRATLSLYAADSFETLASRLSEVLRDDTYTALVSELERLWQGELTFQSQSVNYALDGRRMDILLKGVVLPGHESDWARVLVSIEDISRLEDARRCMVESEQYARGLFEQSPVSLWVEDFSAIKRLLDEIRDRGIVDFRTFIDVHPEFVERCLSEIKVLDVNRYTLKMFGASSKADLLSRMSEVFRDEVHVTFGLQLQDLWDGKLFQQREVMNYSLDGSLLYVHLQFSVFPGHEDSWDKVLLALTDITARKKAEAYLEYLGKHDVQTGLKNRSFYVEELARLDRKKQFPITIVFIDLNDLKGVNDTSGHMAGDALLRRAGEVLSQAIDKLHYAARIGGDEFAILMPGANEDAGALMVDNIRKLTRLNNDFYNGPPLSLSIGVATCHKGMSLDDALRAADLAMYEEKRAYYKSGEARDRRA